MAFFACGPYLRLAHIAYCSAQSLVSVVQTSLVPTEISWWYAKELQVVYASGFCIVRDGEL